MAALGVIDAVLRGANIWHGATPEPDYPHKLTITTGMDGVASPLPVVLLNRATFAYIASKMSDAGGVAEFLYLPNLPDRGITALSPGYDAGGGNYYNAVVADFQLAITTV